MVWVDVTDIFNRTLVGGGHAPDPVPPRKWCCGVRVEIAVEFDGLLFLETLKSPGTNSLSLFTGGKPGFVHVLVTVLRTPGTLMTTVIVPMMELELVREIVSEPGDPTTTLL
jgi:hypothetical protein